MIPNNILHDMEFSIHIRGSRVANTEFHARLQKAAMDIACDLDQRQSKRIRVKGVWIKKNPAAHQPVESKIAVAERHFAKLKSGATS